MPKYVSVATEEAASAAPDRTWGGVGLRMESCGGDGWRASSPSVSMSVRSTNIPVVIQGSDQSSITVGPAGEYKSISSAVDAAQDGAVIAVAPGL